MGAFEHDRLDKLAARLGAELGARGWHMATAESCTGGWVAQSATAIAGSSDWFECGLVAYSNSAKIEMLGVDPMTIERFGAVSAETVAEMATGVLDRCHADVAVAVTGIAGPAGASLGKPVGTVWFGFAGRELATATEMHGFAGDRRAVREQSVALALSRLTSWLP